MKLFLIFVFSSIFLLLFSSDSKLNSKRFSHLKDRNDILSHKFNGKSYLKPHTPFLINVFAKIDKTGDQEINAKIQSRRDFKNVNVVWKLPPGVTSNNSLSHVYSNIKKNQNLSSSIVLNGSLDPGETVYVEVFSLDSGTKIGSLGRYKEPQKATEGMLKLQKKRDRKLPPEKLKRIFQ